MLKNLILALIGAVILVTVLWGLLWLTGTEPVEEVSSKWSASGHADRSSQSFTHWDEDEPPQIPPFCAKCHSAYGYLDFLGEDGSTPRQVDNPAETGSVVNCASCHNDAAHEMTSVEFPSGAEVTGLGQSANCMQCHQGLESTGSVNDAIAGLNADEVYTELGFINVHYAVGAATKMGSEVRVAYQYEGQEYAGFYEHVPDLQWCTECHDSHSTRIQPDECSPCHLNVVDYGDIFDIRNSEVDYDGDGDVSEGIYYEIDAFRQAFYEAMQSYADSVVGTPILYAPSFPYYFIDTDGDGEADSEETSFGNQYATWTPRLVRTAYNYHYVQEDPGRFAHNPEYILQILYDGIEDLNEQVSTPIDTLTRP